MKKLVTAIFLIGIICIPSVATADFRPVSSRDASASPVRPAVTKNLQRKGNLVSGSVSGRIKNQVTGYLVIAGKRSKLHFRVAGTLIGFNPGQPDPNTYIYSFSFRVKAKTKLVIKVKGKTVINRVFLN